MRYLLLLSQLSFGLTKEAPKKLDFKPISLWATHYYTSTYEDLGPTSQSHPLLDKNGNILGPYLSLRSWCNAAMEGSAIVKFADGSTEVFNFSGLGRESQVDCSKIFKHSPSHRVRFKKLNPDKYPLGTGTRNKNGQ